MYGRKRWFSFAYWMHANLNTNLFYDLVLLIECSNCKTTPTLNAQIGEHYSYRVFVFAEIKEPLHHPRRHPRHRPPPTSRWDQPNLHVNMSPIRYDVDKNMYILCCSNRICGSQVAVHVQFTSPSGLCFAGVLINFRSSKFQPLDMSVFSKGHARIFREFWHDLC